MLTIATTSITLTPEARLTTVALALAFGFAVFEMIRRRRLQERYTALWFLYAALLLLVAIFPVILATVADLLGIADPNAALFMLGFVAVGTLLLFMTVTISRQSEQITKLAQEVALQRKEIERLSSDESKGPSDDVD